MSSEEIGQIIEAIGSLNDKYDALVLDFLLFKAKYEASRSKNDTMNEVASWGAWARQFIVALAAALAAIVGVRFTL